ncbi:hypothetical protein LGV61_01925 [Desulfurispirillum indicum]|uniref:DUF2007 domain-containing protein n=1 Tax=Desulfurispirillum indicum (strain ATCC BAA-1389 / DSM 22839 / S5) TaxID=653733 RepID=E6W039_DESIS|nr:hypothetical protein [Desulfurispirillum indicum]ADU65165.1 hypothetical protein Selin_0411 [Desulfurispirillum indicum S5]UCZ57057.1 hypothetical protein LGV61_01925 [Desulfurispirillum indicum]
MLSFEGYELFQEYHDENTANLTMSLLRSADIDCKLEKAKFSAEPVNFAAMSRFNVYVRKGELETAEKIMQTHVSEE